MLRAGRALLQAMGRLVDRQAEAGDQEGNRKDDADVEEVDEAVERVAGRVSYPAVAAEACATGHLRGSAIGGTTCGWATCRADAVVPRDASSEVAVVRSGPGAGARTEACSR